MPRWTFYDFVDEEGNQIERWLNEVVTPSHKNGVRQRLRTRLETYQNSATLRGDLFKPLTGYDGIYEIRFIVKRVPYRPLFCYGPGRGEITLLIGAREHSDNFVPRNAPELARERRAIIVSANGRRYATLHDYTQTA